MQRGIDPTELKLVGGKKAGSGGERGPLQRERERESVGKQNKNKGGGGRKSDACDHMIFFKLISQHPCESPSLFSFFPQPCLPRVFLGNMGPTLSPINTTPTSKRRLWGGGKVGRKADTALSGLDPVLEGEGGTTMTGIVHLVKPVEFVVRENKLLARSNIGRYMVDRDRVLFTNLFQSCTCRCSIKLIFYVNDKLEEALQSKRFRSLFWVRRGPTSQ